jgi:hypothetical protein
MTPFYPVPVPVGPSVLPSRLASFYRWVWKLSQQEGFCWACTGYLADKQGVTERTIYRWLADLRRAGFISSEQTPGVERRITPQKEPSRPRKMSGVRQGSVSGVPTLKRFHAGKAPSAQPANVGGALGTRPEPAGEPEKAEQPSAVVNRLLGLGVSPLIAAQLVRTHGEAVVLAQLDALPHRKARNLAATLVASILHRWQLPAGCVEAQRRAHERAQKTAHDAAQAAQRAEVDRKRQIARERLDGLPEAEKTALEQRARELLSRELPAAARLMLGTRAGAAWVQVRMLAELDRQ